MARTFAMAPAQPAPTTSPDFSSLIGGIYDAAVDPEQWSRVLEHCRQFVGGASATIFSKNVSGTRGRMYHSDGRSDPERAVDYFGNLARIDPSNPVQVYAGVEQAIVTSELLDPEDFANSRFVREWVAPQRLLDMVVAPLERQGDQTLLFGVFRHERDGLGDETTRARVNALAPHVRRALSIGGMLGTARNEAATLREVVDGLAASVFLVDADGRMVHANHAGQQLMGTRGAVTAGHEGTLRIERRSLRDLVPRHEGEPGGSAMVETEAGDRYVIHALALTGNRAGRGAGEAVAALFVRPAGFEAPSVPESLAKAFDLTPGELRVVLATVQHDGVADVAEALGLGEATVRTHLHRVFAKTDTRRQADIVKLVAGFASPLASH